MSLSQSRDLPSFRLLLGTTLAPLSTQFQISNALSVSYFFTSLTLINWPARSLRGRHLNDVCTREGSPKPDERKGGCVIVTVTRKGRGSNKSKCFCRRHLSLAPYTTARIWFSTNYFWAIGRKHFRPHLTWWPSDGQIVVSDITIIALQVRLLVQQQLTAPWSDIFTFF